MQKASTRYVPAGRWRKVQGRGIRWAHSCFVREHIAAVEIGYAATSDVEPAAILCRRQAHETFQRGDGRKVVSGSRGEHTPMRNPW
jgi:hypothetical protein